MSKYESDIHGPTLAHLVCQVALVLSDARRVGANVTEHDPLHPTGRCECDGEGACTWCTMSHYRDENEKLRDARDTAIRQLAEARQEWHEALEATDKENAATRAKLAEARDILRQSEEAREILLAGGEKDEKTIEALRAKLAETERQAALESKRFTSPEYHVAWLAAHDKRLRAELLLQLLSGPHDAYVDRWVTDFARARNIDLGAGKEGG